MKGRGPVHQGQGGFLLETHVRETPHMCKAQWMHQCLDQRSLYHLPSRGGSFSLHCLPGHANLEAHTRSRHLCAEATRRKVTFILGPSWQLRKFQAHFKSILQLPNRICFKSIIASGVPDFHHIIQSYCFVSLIFLLQLRTATPSAQLLLGNGPAYLDNT